MNDISRETELQISRAEFFEQEYFTQKKRVEILQDQCETFRDNIELLTDVIRAKDEEIEAMKDELREIYKRTKIIVPGLTFEEVEDQVNELTKK